MVRRDDFFIYENIDISGDGGSFDQSAVLIATVKASFREDRDYDEMQNGKKKIEQAYVIKFRRLNGIRIDKSYTVGWDNDIYNIVDYSRQDRFELFTELTISRSDF